MKISDNLFSITFQKNIPVSVVFELTSRCNLRCRHCYIPEKDRGQRSEERGQRIEQNSRNELSTEEIKNILSQLAKSGCLYITFTGGEIFLRKDLFEILEYAKELKFDVRIFTNGTLIKKSDIKKLSKLYLSGVEISLYGRRKIHDSITRQEGSFAKTISIIECLIKNKIKVTIKSPIMKLNFSEYRWLTDFARERKINYKFDPIVAPVNNGNKSVLQYRLNTSQLKKIYSDKRLFDISDIQHPTSNIQHSLTCSAGRNFFSVAPDGTVYPCLQLLVPLGNLREKIFSEIWSGETVKKIRKIKDRDIKVCNSCPLQISCQRCPGLAFLEDGDLLGPSKIACKIARIQRAAGQRIEARGEGTEHRRITNSK